MPRNSGRKGQPADRAVVSTMTLPGRSAMDALNRDLATPFGIMLSAPPFTHTPPTVMGGVIYNHGIKENAGIFCHTQSWAVIAEAVANFIAEDDQEWAEEYTQAQRDEFAASIPRLLAALKAASVAVVELPALSEQGAAYPFVRLTPGADDEIALGATCEHLYGINRHEARNVAADLLAAADVAEAQR